VAASAPGVPAAQAPPEAKKIFEETFPYPMGPYLKLSSRFVAAAAYHEGAYGLEE
jgi:hypothetical protein